MPMRAPSLRACGCVVRAGQRCAHMAARDRERKARADANRPTARQRGYDTKWQTESKAFLQAHPACVRCGQPATLVDHRTPHRGDRKLFWSRSNWQPLCTPCHSGAKQREERKGPGVVANLQQGHGTGGGSDAQDRTKMRFSR